MVSDRVALAAVGVLFGAAVLVGFGVTVLDAPALGDLDASGSDDVPTERIAVEEPAATPAPTPTGTRSPTTAPTESPTRSPTAAATSTDSGNSEPWYAYDTATEEPDTPFPTPTETPSPTPTATSTPQDQDGDGLSDARERELGTDPTDADTDGDRLRDGWEVRGRVPFRNGSSVPIPDADPLHKDMYVVYSSSRTVDPVRDYERKDIRQFFAEMPVENPDGEEGITIHGITAPGEDGKIDENIIIDSAEDYDTVENSSARRQLLDNRRYIYHHLMFVHIEEDESGFWGRAQSPGVFSMVDGRKSSGYGGTSSLRVNIAVHELLHNIQGQRGPTAEDGHTEDGWLSTGERPERDEEFLSEPLADYLSENGFADLR